MATSRCGVAHLLRFRAVHVDVKFGLIEGLLNPQIHCAGNEFQLVQQIVGELAVGGEIPPDDLNINRRGQAEIENLADDVRGQE